MNTIRLWEGIRGASEGYDSSFYHVVECEAEHLGSWSETIDGAGNRGVSYDVYRTSEGTILIHKVRWSRWSNERDSALLMEYATLEEAAQRWRRVLENAGVIQRQVLTLAEWRRARKEQEE